MIVTEMMVVLLRGPAGPGDADSCSWKPKKRGKACWIIERKMIPRWFGDNAMQ